MKKLLVAAVLAAAVMAGSRHKASAWSEFKWSAGFSISWTRSGSQWYFGRYSPPYPGCPGGDCGYGVGWAGWGDASHGAYPSYDYGSSSGSSWQAPAPAPAGGSGSGGGTQRTQVNWGTGYQPVGYNYQAPSYWYGR
jgi:hypothetical protein